LKNFKDDTTYKLSTLTEITIYMLFVNRKHTNYEFNRKPYDRVRISRRSYHLLAFVHIGNPEVGVIFDQY